tara:strand:- start:65 stop:649 length:585 start_codon:yes stop_codon:yes gene_type:complete
MASRRTGEWKIVMYVDGVDSEGKSTYQHIYQHKDGRKAYVGPDYCSDPDLEWILFHKNRETKAWNKRYAKREKISFYVFAAAWLALLIQGVSSYQEKGILVLLSILGYWVTKSGGLGFINNFRDLIIRKTSFHGERKIANFLIVICVIYFGHWLIHIGQLHSLSILFLEIPVLWFGLFMGLVEGALHKWKEETF